VRRLSIPILYIALRFPIHHNELGSRYQQLGNKTPDWTIFFGPEYDGCVCGTFEMLRSVVQPGGEAEPHHHETEHQIIDLLRGEGDVSLGEDSPVRCTAGAIVRIPPRLRHFVVNAGAEPLKMIVI